MHLPSDGQRSSHDTERMDGELKPSLRHSNMMDPRDVSIDVLSFKSDIFNCLDMCTAYIQALNTLCSTGAVLAQNLTQVFSRDVNVDGENLVSKSSMNSSGSNKISRRGFFGFKNPRRGEGIRTNASSLDELDSNYYEVAEQFLQVWETMSVSTAGASATIKTDTLVALQDILNNLEQENSCSKSGDLGGNNLEGSIRAAKTCLLAYIELQAQFSYNSWKSLNHLSKVLRSDPSMADVVNNVKKHFSSKTPECHAQDVPESGVLREEKGRKAARSGSSNTLDSAMNLLSLESVGCSGRRKRHSRSRCRKARVPGVKSSKVTSSQLPQKQQPLQSFEQGVPTSGLGNSAIMIKQSTWPGKEAATSVKRNEFPRPITSTDDWSMWPDLRPNDFFNDGVNKGGTDAFLLPWNTFSNNSSSASSNSTINGSTDQGNVERGMTLPTTCSNGSHFEAFSQGGGSVKLGGFSETNDVRFNDLLDDRTNLSVIELAKKLSLSNEGGKDLVFDSPTGYTFATDPFAPSTIVNSGQLPHSLDGSRTSKTSTWPMKQANGFNGNVDWLPSAFDSFDLAPRFFHSDPTYNQGSSNPWPFDDLMKQSSVSDPTSKVSTGFNNLFTSSESNNNGHF